MVYHLLKRLLVAFIGASGCTDSHVAETFRQVASDHLSRKAGGNTDVSSLGITQGLVWKGWLKVHIDLIGFKVSVF